MMQPFLWYNVIVQKQTPQEYYTAYQLKLPVEIEKIIEISDPVYSFSEVMDHIDLNKYLTIEERRLGRPRYDQKTLLKIILFAFMENGYASVRENEKYCKTDIRYMWLLQDNPPPSHMTIDNFMNKTMLENIDRIFADVNEYIFQKEQVDLNHVYIDGTKISANAAKTLGVSTDRLEAFFDNIDISYDDYINKLNSKNQTLAALKTSIETNYDCTFGEYIETVITVNNKTIPDAKKYDAFKSNLSVFDVYIRSNELNYDKNKLINYDVEIQSADTDNDVYAFDIIAKCLPHL